MHVLVQNCHLHFGTYISCSTAKRVQEPAKWTVLLGCLILMWCDSALSHLSPIYIQHLPEPWCESRTAPLITPRPWAHRVCDVTISSVSRGQAGYCVYITWLTILSNTLKTLVVSRKETMTTNKQGDSSWSWSWVHFTRVADNGTLGLFHLLVLILYVYLHKLGFWLIHLYISLYLMGFALMPTFVGV